MITDSHNAKNQHHVQRAYLSNFIDPKSGRLTVYDMKEKRLFDTASLRSIGCRDENYSIINEYGCLDRGIDKEITFVESECFPVIQEIVDSESIDGLKVGDKFSRIVSYIALSILRSDSHRLKWGQLLVGIITKGAEALAKTISDPYEIAKKLKATWKPFSVEDILLVMDLSSVDSQHGDKIDKASYQMTAHIVGAWRSFSANMMGYSVLLFYNDTDQVFCTGDCSVDLHGDENRVILDKLLPYNSIGEITMTISPRLAIVLHRRSDLNFTKFPITEKKVKQINARIAYNSQRFIYANKNDYGLGLLMKKYGTNSKQDGQIRYNDDRRTELLDQVRFVHGRRPIA
jgi:hypothetical protein